MTTPSEQPNLPHATLRGYTLGFILSILLTFGSFWFAPTLGVYAAAGVVAGAILQLFVQLTFFMHISNRAYPRSNLLVLVLTAIIIGIVVGGTLWIMSNLNHLHVHAPATNQLYQNGVVAPQNELH